MKILIVFTFEASMCVSGIISYTGKKHQPASGKASCSERKLLHKSKPPGVTPLPLSWFVPTSFAQYTPTELCRIPVLYLHNTVLGNPAAAERPNKFHFQKERNRLPASIMIVISFSLTRLQPISLIPSHAILHLQPTRHGFK